MKKLIIFGLMLLMMHHVDAQMHKINGWRFLPGKTAEQYEVLVTDAERHSGEKSLEVLVKGKGGGRLVHNVKNLSEDGKYSLIFFYKTSEDFSGYFYVAVGNKRQNCRKSADGWSKVEIRDISAVKDLFMAIWFSPAKGRVYLDDFSLMKQN